MAFRKAKAVYLLYAISTTVIVVMVHLSGVLNTNSTRAVKTQNAHKGTLKPEQWEGAPRMPQSRMEGAAVLNASRPKVIPVNEISFLIIRENCKDDLPKRRQKAFLLFHFFKEEPWVKFFYPYRGHSHKENPLLFCSTETMKTKCTGKAKLPAEIKKKKMTFTNKNNDSKQL